MTKRTKILYIITKSNWGGAQRYVYDLATALPRNQFEVAVVVGNNGLLVDRLRSAHIRVISIAHLQRDISLVKDLKVLRELYRIFKKELPHIVHLNSSKIGGLGGIAARFAHIPCIIFTAHGWAFNEKRPFWQRILLYISYIITIILTDKTICVSNAVFHDMHNAPIISNKLKIIPLGINSPVYKTREEARRLLFPNNTKRRWIGIVSELHPTKCIEDAIAAIEKLRKHYPNILLLVAGNGKYRTFLEKEIMRRNVSKNVRLLGFIPEVATYMKAFDIFVFPSHTEALGYALLEAGAAALPVIATRVGGIPEVITNDTSGILIPPGHPKQLASAISRFLEDTVLRKRMGETLMQYVHTNFDFERMVTDTVTLYHLYI